MNTFSLALLQGIKKETLLDLLNLCKHFRGICFAQGDDTMFGMISKLFFGYNEIMLDSPCAFMEVSMEYHMYLGPMISLSTHIVYIFLKSMSTVFFNYFTFS